MEVKASVKNLRISARKLRLVVDEVRGMSVSNARRTLQYMNKKGAEPTLKLINSAAANATHNYKLSEDSLVIAEIAVDEGFTIKRFRARAFGRAGMIRKRTSSIRVTVKSQEPKKVKAKKAEVKEEDGESSTPVKADKPATKKAAKSTKN